jgi:PPE-repeat protein
LVATNIVGQNTPAIAATEAQYAEMWAQDAAAMYGYAGASAAATTVTPFTSPPPTTNPAGTVTQATAAATGTTQSTLAQLLSQVPSTLQSLASGGSFNGAAAISTLLSTPANQFIEPLVGALGGDAVFLFGPMIVGGSVLGLLSPLLSLVGEAPVAAVSAVSGVPGGALGTLAGSYGSGLGGAGVSAGLGGAAAVGGLSVPQSWGTAAPAIRLAATALPAAGLDGLPQAGAAGLGGSFGGMPMMGGVVNAPRYGAAGPRSESRFKVIPQIAAAPGVHEGTRDPGMKPTGRAADAVDALSDHERYELQTLREKVAEMAMERVAATQVIKEAMRR